MYSDHDNYRGGDFRPRGNRSYNYRGRGRAFGNSRPYGGGHNNRYNDPEAPPLIEYNQGGPYNGGGFQRGERNHYQGGRSGGRPFGGYRGDSYRRNSSGFFRYDRGGRYSRDHQSFGRRGGGQVNNYDPNYQRNDFSDGRRRGSNRSRRPYTPRRNPPQERWRDESGHYNDPPANSFQQGQSHELPPGLSWCCDLEGHSGAVNCVTFDEDSCRLFSGGADGIVREWNAYTGQVENTVNYHGEVTALLVESHFLFVAVDCVQNESGNQNISSGDIHIYNLDAQSEQKFMAHVGRIYQLHATGDVLLSAGDDRIIKGWKFNDETKLFNDAGGFGEGNTRHRGAVSCMTTIGSYLFSGDYTGAIYVWNMENGSLVQVLNEGHSQSITSMICWRGSLITGSLDRRISAWGLDLGQTSQQVVQTPPCYYSEVKNARGQPAEVISMFGMPDPQNKPLVMAGLGSHEVIIYDLPSFAVKGRIENVQYPLGLSGAAQSSIFIGQGNGSIRIFSWEDESTDDSSMVA